MGIYWTENIWNDKIYDHMTSQLWQQKALKTQNLLLIDKH